MSDQIRNKLYQYSEEPPAGAWDAIASALNNESDTLLAQKLYSFQQQPPDSVWKAIKEQLPENTPAVISPISNPAFLRWAAAAAVLILLAISSIWYTHQPAALKKTALTTIPARIKKIGTEQALPSPALAIENRNPVSDDNKLKMPKSANASKHLVRKAVTLIPKRGVAINAEIVASPANEADITSENTPVAINDSDLDRYMIFSSAQGSVVKLSKKLFQWFECAYNSSSQTCQPAITHLQKKIAASGVAPYTDFMGMMDMIKKVQEDQ